MSHLSFGLFSHNSGVEVICWMRGVCTLVSGLCDAKYCVL